MAEALGVSVVEAVGLPREWQLVAYTAAEAEREVAEVRANPEQYGRWDHAATASN